MANQLFRGLGVKTRVGAQKRNERIDAALELQFLDDGEHFRADARHLGQSDFMDFVRGKVERGHRPYPLPVVFRTFGQLRSADTVANVFPVLRVEKLRHPPQRRQHLPADDLAGVRREPLAVRLAQRIGQALEWFEKGAVPDRLSGRRGYRRQYALQHDPRRDESVGNAGAHVLDVLIHVPGIARKRCRKSSYSPSLRKLTPSAARNRPE